MVVLTNGCVFGFPPGEVPGLEDAPAHLLSEVEVESAGEGLHWEALDADVSVPGIIARLTNVQALAAKFLGRATSTAKARAARENGMKGGRPRKGAVEARGATAKPPVRDAA